jgi:N6-L-threonylcarbamoyladenine synthase
MRSYHRPSLVSAIRRLVSASRYPSIHTARRALTVLALESSADDSCAAIVDSDRRIISNVVIKQHHLNIKHGGIHPLEAQHAHERNVVCRESPFED